MIQRPQSSQSLPQNAKLVFKGKIFDFYQWEQELYNGTYKIFEKIKRLDTVLVIPVMDGGNILMLEEIQPGKEPYLSTPGGRLEEGEDPEEAVRRELKEETGYEAEQMMLLDSFQPVNKIDWAVYIFIAKKLKKVTEPELDGGEKISLKQVSFEDFLKIASDKNYQEDKEVRLKILEALVDPMEMKRLKEMILE